MFYWCYLYLFTIMVFNMIYIRVPLVEQGLFTLPKYLSSPPVFQWNSCCSLVFCIVVCISLCSFSFGHCIVCPSSIYSFWLPLWYLQTFHRIKFVSKNISWSQFMSNFNRFFLSTKAEKCLVYRCYFQIIILRSVSLNLDDCPFGIFNPFLI
jgi:hypothetical protein